MTASIAHPKQIPSGTTTIRGGRCGAPASVGNGGMVALWASSWAQVDGFHAAALAHGGASEGAPGLRLLYNPDFYAAYVRDPDGNKLAVVCRGFTRRDP